MVIPPKILELFQKVNCGADATCVYLEAPSILWDEKSALEYIRLAEDREAATDEVCAAFTRMLL